MSTLAAIPTRSILDGRDTEALPLTPLERAILAAGVRVLDEDVVKDYQADALKKARRWWSLRGMDPWKVCGMLLGSVIFGISVAGLTRLVFLLVSKVTGPVAAPDPAPVSISLGLGGSYAILLACKWMSEHRAYQIGWRRYAVAYLDGGDAAMPAWFKPGPSLAAVKIPPQAVSICHRVADNLRGSQQMTAGIEQLDDGPFIYLTTDGLSRYYVFAWDEKDFVPRY